MTRQRSLIGKEIDREKIIIESGRVKRLYCATNQPDPFDAQKNWSIEPKSSNQALPKYFFGSLLNLPRIYNYLELNIKNILLSRESIIAHENLHVGDEVYVSTYLKDAYEQQASSNPIGFIILESLGANNEKFIFYSERVLAIRGGFERRKGL